MPLSELVDVMPSAREKTIYHKDLLPVVFVVGDMGGKLDSPLYGMFDMRDALKDKAAAAGRHAGRIFHQPAERSCPGPYRQANTQWAITGKGRPRTRVT